MQSHTTNEEETPAAQPQAKKKDKKEQLTKAQKRRLVERFGEFCKDATTRISDAVAHTQENKHTVITIQFVVHGKLPY